MLITTVVNTPTETDADYLFAWHQQNRGFFLQHQKQIGLYFLLSAKKQPLNASCFTIVTLPPAAYEIYIFACWNQEDIKVSKSQTSLAKIRCRRYKDKCRRNKNILVLIQIQILVFWSRNQTSPSELAAPSPYYARSPRHHFTPLYLPYYTLQYTMLYRIRMVNQHITKVDQPRDTY